MELEQGLREGRTGAVRRVLFYGKSMARSRCTGALVDALREHGLEVRWRNLARWRRWFGRQRAHALARREFRAYRPDLVFVFYRDLAPSLLEEFSRDARVVIWCEEALEDLDASVVDLFRHADLVCLSNPARMPWLREQGLDNLVFLMSGFSLAYHRPAAPRRFVRDVAFIGGPGRRGQRAEFLAGISTRFRTTVFGLHWRRWASYYPQLELGGEVRPRGYARICAESRIVLGINEVNDDELYCSNRTFLTLACGGFHLTHYVPGLERVFRDGEHLAFYEGADEALDKIAWWLDRDVERRRIASAGHLCALEHHRYYHRVARVLHILREGLPDDPTAELLPSPARARSGD